MANSRNISGLEIDGDSSQTIDYKYSLKAKLIKSFDYGRLEPVNHINVGKTPQFRGCTKHE